MFRQYQAIKAQYPDTLLLFRLGDFYEMFGEDAEIASRVLGLTLTAREGGKDIKVPMCGVPYHAVERYLAQLIQHGFRAAICEQTEDPKKAKGLVKRAVTRVVTAGTVVEDSMLEARANNFLLSVRGDEKRQGLAVIDVSTGEFLATEIQSDDPGMLLQEISRFNPSEILVPKSSPLFAILKANENRRLSAGEGGRTITEFDLEPLSVKSPAERLREHFGSTSLRGFGCEDLPLAIEAAAAILDYLGKTQMSALEHVRGLTVYSTDSFMTLDATTRRNLEINQSLRDGSTRGTLLWLLDHTETAMGGRLLRQWLNQPLIDRCAIEGRLDVVETLYGDLFLRRSIADLLRQIADLERLVARAAAGTANARDLLAISRTLDHLPELQQLLAANPRLQHYAARLDTCGEIAGTLREALADDPPATITEGGLFRDGYNEELDALRRGRREGKEWIANLEATERERTGIKSLKVGFNSVFGYYIEVTKANQSLVPAHYIRKQTTVNAERYITPELKEWEARVLGAEEKIAQLEYDLFVELRSQVAHQSDRLLQTAKAIAEVDVLNTWAEIASRNRYVRPRLNEGDTIHIVAGRHPVVEQTQKEPFIPNDTLLDGKENQVLIITGPNMAGKSTYLRQVALIVLMAQIGCFVPAESATIGIVDRIFTRVGAQDDLATGQSTFMVEMNETANILHNATDRSLVILDEIGRGTSTFDGLSIAWAVAEYLHELGAKTLFATHYHHLNELESQCERVKNYRIAVKEREEEIIFLRKIVRGGTDRSYGIQVARLAGLPHQVIERAKQVLWTLENENGIGRIAPDAAAVKRVQAPVQLTLFEVAPDPLVEELKLLQVEDMTPVQALNVLADLKERARQRATTRNRRRKD